MYNYLAELPVLAGEWPQISRTTELVKPLNENGLRNIFIDLSYAKEWLVKFLNANPPHPKSMISQQEMIEYVENIVQIGPTILLPCPPKEGGKMRARAIFQRYLVNKYWLDDWTAATWIIFHEKGQINADSFNDLLHATKAVVDPPTVFNPLFPPA